ncbi:MAG: glycosyltransferase family 1 protein, partial [Candidatus Brocadiales bacterium]|nr:glycosyltransferase family 1 protein [Candidatus Brocadiales bacterium]
FEIPATRTMMLSEYSDDLAVLFTEGKEAEFFRNKEELSDKLTHYIKNNEMRRTVAAAGYNRVVNDGHDIVSRMKKVLSWVEELHAIGGKV